METAAIAAIAAATGAISGAIFGALTTLKTNKQNLRQREREALIERAYEAAKAEHNAHLEVVKLEASTGRARPIPAFYRYLVYHLVLLSRLNDLHYSDKLDADSIARTLEEASSLSRTERRKDVDTRTEHPG
ncbi:hypothetical protein WM36_02280 [Burkholderia ubonensis]|nr:hypothetical protein WM36_02280 [Burkholderia ubonensis]KVO56166.1 hypothetical protein WJ77_13855 [Burkholderia ubonensis]